MLKAEYFSLMLQGLETFLINAELSSCCNFSDSQGVI